MKRIPLLFFCVSILNVIALKAQDTSKDLTDAQKAYVLSKFCTEVKYNYVFYNDLTFDWDSLCESTLPILLATKSKDEYVRELQRLCTKLKDGHTYIYEQNSENGLEWIRPFPFKTKRIGNRVFVTSVQSSVFQKQGLEIGSEIIQIDGLDVMEYVNRYKRPLKSASTSQWLDYAPYAEFELTKEKGTKVSNILFKNKDGKTFTIESHRNIQWDLPGNGIFNFTTLKGNVGLLKINTFMGNDFEKEFDTLYSSIKKTDALIIDVRDNMGGISSYADYILSHFSSQPVKKSRWSSRMYIAAHGSWGYPQEWYMEAPYDMTPVKKENIYTKPIVVLVNAVTFSSAENFCVTFRGMRRGKIIGMPTGGSTGNPINLNLGYGIGAVICTKNDWDIDGNKFIGIGIKPDMEVQESADIFLKGKDVVIEEALKQIGRDKK